MTTTRREPAHYELAHTPVTDQWTVRENLTDILQRELVGPMYGASEVLNTSPDTAYLVGRLAPSRLSSRGEDPSSAEADPDDDQIGTAEDAAESTGVPVLSDDDTPADGDEDSAEDTVPKRGLMIPASMGLRFQVPTDLASVDVTASWGAYSSRNSQEETAEGARPKREFIRTPVEVTETLDLQALTAKGSDRITLSQTVVLDIDTALDDDRLVIEIALCNDRTTPGRIPLDAWLFQTELRVSAGDQAVFLPVRDALLDTEEIQDPEEGQLALQFRHHLEFGVGRTCSADWEVEPGQRRASSVWTTWLPVSETAPTRAAENPAVVTDMRKLSTLDVDGLRTGLEPIASAYAEWLSEQKATAATLPAPLRAHADDVIHEATKAHENLVAGIQFLLDDEEALRCFRFANRVMAEQRIAGQVVEMRKNDAALSYLDAVAAVEAKGTGAHSWRLFQLAFVLMQLPQMCDPAHKRRAGTLARVELLFFPTGGGKTEAYLGMAAFTLAIRRRQGVVESSDGLLDGGSGMAILMRYTLRLLTAQQFQRATSMICAAELERIDDPGTWGNEPFRIGLWVGSSVSPKRVKEAADQLRVRNDEGSQRGLTVLQVRRCPWCGTPINGVHATADLTLGRVYVPCEDEYADCPFARGGRVAEGLPILTVDEEIYRLAPCFVIATVDKFARLAREGEAASMFGYVSERCERHGFVHPDSSVCDIKDGSKHPAKHPHPPATVRPAMRLRPPDLVIQDELHLITGALGTTVGLFEVAIDVMCSWTTPEGKPCGPVVVASSATVRNAAEQVRSLYGRRASIFPPRVLDVGDTYFSREVPVSKENPGRRYVGVCASGTRLTAAEIRVSEVLLAAGQLMLDEAGAAADPYMTLVGYFNATRELAGMARLMNDDVQTGLAIGRPWSALPRRSGAIGSIHKEELTSRVSGANIGQTLDRLAVTFDPERHSTSAREAWRDLPDDQKKRASGPAPYDVVLATSMLQVGVDVPRLGLMLIVGQPKNTAEYIQASSRVGRAGPGLVVTMGNWARPRDLAHFEQFRHYHETFYAQVEALSVTPFSTTAIERGTDGMLVAAVRVLDAVRGRDGLSPEGNAGQLDTAGEVLESVRQRLLARAESAAEEGDQAMFSGRLTNRLDAWKQRRKVLAAEHSKALVYEKIPKTRPAGPLMMSAEAAVAAETETFVVANSMRDVQPEINVLVSPDPTRLRVVAPESVAAWAFPITKED